MKSLKSDNDHLKKSFGEQIKSLKEENRQLLGNNKALKFKHKAMLHGLCLAHTITVPKSN